MDDAETGPAGPGSGPDAATAAGRRPRLADVAVRAGVSSGLVSLVLRNQPGPSEQTRTRVIETAQQMGYRADRTASLLARRRSRHLGVMMDVRNTFHAELVADLDTAATRHGYDLLLSTVTSTRDERRAAEVLLDFRCEALILLGPDDPAGRLNALGRQLPVVVIGRRIRSASADVVRAADDQGVAEAVSHLGEAETGADDRVGRGVVLCHTPDVATCAPRQTWRIAACVPRCAGCRRHPAGVTRSGGGAVIRHRPRRRGPAPPDRPGEPDPRGHRRR